MVVTRSSGRLQHNPPKTPPSQVMQTQKTPPAAPTKARSERDVDSPLSRLTTARRLSPDESDVTRDMDLFESTSESSEENISPTESEMADFLPVPPFTASQIQMILWLSWTTTATPTQIANMHNRAFSESPHTMSRWNVINIENDVATNWHERGRSFTGMEPLSLLVPPGDNNSWSCLCDFGVDNCWDYKRDKESGENLEKLSMARMLWDGTPKELVRCPHGRRTPGEGVHTATLAPRPSMLRRLGDLLPALPRWPRSFAKFWFIMDCGYSIFEMSFKGWISVDAAQNLLCAWLLGTAWLLTTWVGFDFARLLCSLAWLVYGMYNPNVPPSVKIERTVLASMGYSVYFLGPGIRARTLKAMQVYLGILWAWSIAFTALDIDRDLGRFPEWVGVGFMLWLLQEVNWRTVLKTRAGWVMTQYEQRRFIKNRR